MTCNLIFQIAKLFLFDMNRVCLQAHYEILLINVFFYDLLCMHIHPIANLYFQLNELVKKKSTSIVVYLSSL